MYRFLGMLKYLLFQRVQVIIVIALPVIMAHTRVLSLKSTVGSGLLRYVHIGIDVPAFSLRTLSPCDVGDHYPCDTCGDQNHQKYSKRSSLAGLSDRLCCELKLPGTEEWWHGNGKNKEYWKAYKPEYN